MGASFTDLRDEEEEEVDGRLRSIGPRGSRVGMRGSTIQGVGDVKMEARVQIYMVRKDERDASNSGY